MNLVDEKRERLLADLILRWEDLVLSGGHPTVAELCRDCPEMAAELERTIIRLEQLHRFLFPEASALTRPMTPTSPFGRPLCDAPLVPGYEVLTEIGRGGMGVVFKARQKSLKRIVAIKVLRSLRLENSSYAARLRWEAEGLSLLAHPNVVKVFDVIEIEDGSVAIILEYIEGDNLTVRLKRAKMTPNEAAGVALVLAQTLAFVHECGLLHRDIKPANVLVDRAGHIKVVDFGLVKGDPGRFAATEANAEARSHGSTDVDETLFDSGRIGNDGLTLTGDYFGTPSYMAPEQIPGSARAVDFRTDVYGIGATLYEMLSGRPPFAGASETETLDQVQHQDPVPLRISNREIPPDLETIYLKCLKKDPAERFQSSQELADELERFQRGIPIHSRPIGSLERCRRWCRRRPALASLWGLSVLASLAILSLILVNNWERDVAAKRAQSLQRIAEEHEQAAKEALYLADMNRAGMALRQNDTRELMRLLQLHIPDAGEIDRRGFEWWHLYRRAIRAGKSLLNIGHAQYILCRTPEPSELAVAGADSIVRIFHRDSGEVLQQIPTGQIEVNGIAFSPDGREMATAGDDGTIIFWDRTTSAARLKINAHPAKAYQLVYTRDGSRIVTCGDNPVIRVFTVQTGELVFTLDGHTRPVENLVLSDDGKVLISTSVDHTVRLWSLGIRKELMSFESNGDSGPVVYRQERGLLIVGDASGELKTYDTTKKLEMDRTQYVDKIGALALHPEGILLAIGDASGQIHLRRVKQNGEFVKEESKPWLAHHGQVYSLMWSSDGSRLTSTGIDGQVLSWDLVAAQTTEPTEHELRQNGDFCLRPNSTSLFLSSTDSKITHWDWSSGKSEGEVIDGVHTFPAISPDGKLLALISPHGSDEAFNRADQLQIYAFPSDSNRILERDLVAEWNAEPGELTNIQFSPDSKSIAVSRKQQNHPDTTEEHVVWLLRIAQRDFERGDSDRETPLVESAERIPVASARNSRFSPDGHRLALVTQKGLVHWNVAQKNVEWEISNSWIQQLAYSPDGSLIATCGSDRRVIVVNANDGLLRFQSSNHRASTLAITFSPDGRLLVSADSDGGLKFWNVASGQELLELQEPGWRIEQIEFIQEGRRLLLRAARDRILVFNGSPLAL